VAGEIARTISGSHRLSCCRSGSGRAARPRSCQC
jgi:hypothetical protein